MANKMDTEDYKNEFDKNNLWDTLLNLLAGGSHQRICSKVLFF